MDKEEYHKQLLAIQAHYENEKMRLATECAKSNNPYKIGDILKDDRDTIVKVERISFSYGYGNDIPYCVYHGSVLKKDLTPRKVKPLNESIVQPRVIAKLN